MEKIAVFWFRRDLRLNDNAGLAAALSSGLPVLPLFIFDSDILSHLEDRDDRRVSFIYTALQQLQAQVLEKGSSFVVHHGKPESVFLHLLETYAVEAIYTNHDYEPYARRRDAAIEKMLQERGVAFRTYKDQVIFERNEVVKDDGGGYMVYTPFAKKWRALLQPQHYKPFRSETLLSRLYPQPPQPFPSLQEMEFNLHPNIPAVHPADEQIIRHYHQTRDIPSLQGTTRMGVHLRFGTVSIRQLVARALQLNAIYLGELIWREFFMQVLWHHPRVEKEACKQAYDNIHWRNNENEFRLWCRGQTGYPVVDAGMRELNETGFMHNRVRMIVGSFLVKDLLVDWRWGEAYFARKLLDFELASNNGNWQWVAGCGCDAAPYFRVFNPDTQAKKFDPKANYIRRWVPEFDGFDYPEPIVDHTAAKERCIKAYKAALQKQ